MILIRYFKYITKVELIIKDVLQIPSYNILRNLLFANLQLALFYTYIITCSEIEK